MVFTWNFTRFGSFQNACEAEVVYLSILFSHEFINALPVVPIGFGNTGVHYERRQEA